MASIATPRRTTARTARPVRGREPVTGRPRPVTAPRPTAQPRPRLRLVDDARRKAAARRRRARLVVFVAGVLVVGCLFALAAFNAVLVSGQGRLDHLERQVTDAQSRYSATRLEVAQLEAPARIVDVARRRLGMVPPPGVRYLTPSEAMAEQAGTTTASTPPASASRDDRASWAAVKPYLASRP